MKIITKSLLVILMIITSACSKEDVKILSSEAIITRFSINNIEGVISGNTIVLSLPNGVDLTNLSAQATISNGSTIDPNPEDLSNYTNSREFTIVAEDGTTRNIYTVKVTEEAVVPTADNPFPEGVFILDKTQNNDYELGFRHTSGSISPQIFQNANNGRRISGFTITDIVPHNNGYLIFSNKDDGSGGQLFYTNLKFEIQKEVSLDKCNVKAGKYAQLGDTLYYTNVSSIVEVNQFENKAYIIDIKAQTLKTVDNQILQFFTTSDNELYYLTIINGLYKVTDTNTLAGVKVEDFDDYSTSFVLDGNDKLWSISNTRYPNSFADIFSLGRGTFDYKLHVACYDLNSNTKTEGTDTEDINRNSSLFVYNDNVYIITNQNSHIANAKKKLQKLILESNVAKLEQVHELPKSSLDQHVTNDLDAIKAKDGTVYVFGADNEVAAANGLKSFYYELDLASGNVSNKKVGIVGLFQGNQL